MSIVSRRIALRRIAAVLASSLDAAGESGDFKLVHQLSGAVLLDIAPNSSELCAYFGKLGRQFAVSPDGRSKELSNKRSENRVAIVGTEDWRISQEIPLPATAHSGSFFSDSKAVYIEVPGVGQGGRARTLIDLDTRTHRTVLDSYCTQCLSYSYSAANDRDLIGAGRRVPGGQMEVLVRVVAGTLQEVRRTAYGDNRAPVVRLVLPFVISKDRKRVLCFDGNSVLCRDADSLALLWKTEVSPRLVVMSAAVSFDGSYVAIAASNNVDRQLPSRQSQVTFLAGEDGSVMREIPIDGTEGLAVSRDGKLLAAGHRIHLPGRPSGTQATVAVVDPTSGKHQGMIIQEQLRGNGKEFLDAGFAANGIQFTPDGKYLVTSGINTKVWQIT